jgi:hypothetical protein
MPAEAHWIAVRAPRGRRVADPGCLASAPARALCLMRRARARTAGARSSNATWGGQTATRWILTAVRPTCPVLRTAAPAARTAGACCPTPRCRASTAHVPWTGAGAPSATAILTNPGARLSPWATTRTAANAATRARAGSIVRSPCVVVSTAGRVTRGVAASATPLPLAIRRTSATVGPFGATVRATPRGRHASDGNEVVALALIGLSIASCGMSSGNQAASLAADAVSTALTGPSGPEKPAAWSISTARCGVFRDHGTACPVPARLLRSARARSRRQARPASR